MTKHYILEEVADYATLLALTGLDNVIYELQDTGVKYIYNDIATAFIPLMPFEVATQTTGNDIDFNIKKVYNTFSSPTTGDLTNTLTNALLGVVQKIYHNDTVEPTWLSNWKRLGDGVYVPNEVNIIYAEWAGGTRVEYWIVQEQ